MLRCSLVRAAFLLCFALAGCCVIVVENDNGPDGGNPFQQVEPLTDSGYAAPVAVCRFSSLNAVLDGGFIVQLGATVDFDGADSQAAAGDTDIVAWDWDFGDGATATGSFPTHAYGDAGLFITTLTVTDDQGLTAQNSCSAITVQN